MAVIPDVVFPDELPAATDADMLLLHLHAHQALAHRSRQCRKPSWKKTSHEAGLRRRWRFRLLLVPYTGDTSDEIVGRVSIDISDDNGANSEPHFGIHEQLCQSYPLRLPQRQFSKSFSKNYLLQTSIGAKQTIGTIDEDYESCQYR